jgi:hypothetical protein
MLADFSFGARHITTIRPAIAIRAPFLETGQSPLATE